MHKKYDYLVIGSGPAGHMSALRAVQLGLKTAVVELSQEMFGGACLNEGCIPAKSLYHSAKIVKLVRQNAGLCGLGGKDISADLASIVAKSREAVQQLSSGLSFLFRKHGIEIITGKAEFSDAETVVVKDGKNGAVEIKADKVLVAAGSSPRSLPGLPFDGKYIINSSHAVRLAKLPRKILIVGGGVIGMEFASFFNLLGSETTIVEAEGSILPNEDGDVVKYMESLFRKKGIDIHTSSKVKEAVVEKGAVKVALESERGAKEERYELVLVSAGRVPSSSGMGLDKAGVKTDDCGFIIVNGAMATNVKSIFAAGDIVGSPMVAHIAAAEGEIAAESAAGKKIKPIDPRCVPNAVYTDIEAASVGFTEEEAKKKGINTVTAKHFFKANGRAVANFETEGFIKIIVNKDTRKFEGVHIVGEGASELIHEFVVAKKNGLTADAISNSIHAHPTFSETAVGVARAVFDRSA